MRRWRGDEICIFEPLETAIEDKDFAVVCCDLLSNLYLWTIGNNTKGTYIRSDTVVICFQICTFEPLETTPPESMSNTIELWFAFKFVPLNHWKQLRPLGHGGIHVVICFQICTFEPLETTEILFFPLPLCCDLLSNLYLWTIGNNSIVQVIVKQ